MNRKNKISTLVIGIIYIVCFLLVYFSVNCDTPETTKEDKAVYAYFEFDFVDSKGMGFHYVFDDSIQPDNDGNYLINYNFLDSLKRDTLTKYVEVNPEDTLQLINKLYRNYANGIIDTLEQINEIQFKDTFYSMLYEWSVDIPVIHDTTESKPDTVYLPAFVDGDRVHLEFDFKDNEPVRFACNFEGEQDTVQKFGMFSNYEQLDSLIHYSRNWRYNLNMGVGQTVDTTYIDGEPVYKQWQVVDLTLQAFDFFGNPSLPTPPFKHIYVKELKDVE